MSDKTDNADKPTNTGGKQGKRKKNMPPKSGMFFKGDPRINRKGRPRKADMLRDALLEKWDTVAPPGRDGKCVEVDGKPATYGQIVIERMFRDSKQFGELLNRAFGKVKDEVELSGCVDQGPKIDLSRLTDDEVRAMAAIEKKVKVE